MIRTLALLGLATAKRSIDARQSARTGGIVRVPPSRASLGCIPVRLSKTLRAEILEHGDDFVVPVPGGSNGLRRIVMAWRTRSAVRWARAR